MPTLQNKRWCVYYGIGVGYIEKEYDDGCLLVRYSEGQQFELQHWNPVFIDRFETWREALTDFKKYGSHFRGYSSPEEYVTEGFPTYTQV